LPSLLTDLKRRIFWIVARTCFTLYRCFPLFGALRASLAVIQRGEKFLVIHRNDGRGFSLPGGLCGWREAEDVTLDREVLEETGLRVSGKKLVLRFYTTAEIPCAVSLFFVEATGELKNSWEGSPQWITVAEFEQRFVESQRPALEVLRKMSGSHGHNLRRTSNEN